MMSAQSVLVGTGTGHLEAMIASKPDACDTDLSRET